jgi:hypothetical protein
MCVFVYLARSLARSFSLSISIQSITLCPCSRHAKYWREKKGGRGKWQTDYKCSFFRKQGMLPHNNYPNSSCLNPCYLCFQPTPWTDNMEIYKPLPINFTSTHTITVNPDTMTRPRLTRGGQSGLLPTSTVHGYQQEDTLIGREGKEGEWRRRGRGGEEKVGLTGSF